MLEDIELKNNKARQETIRYHSNLFRRQGLFESGSWLDQVDSDMEPTVSALPKKNSLKVLDLGCGPGRNTIYLANQLGSRCKSIVAVDLLEIAVQKLQENVEHFGFRELVRPICCPIENFAIGRDEFDLILAISVLEHLSSKETYDRTIRAIQEGTQQGGLNRLLTITSLREWDLQDQKALHPLVEQKIETQEAKDFLTERYKDWEILILKERPFEERLTRGGREILWCCDYLSFLARRNV